MKRFRIWVLVSIFVLASGGAMATPTRVPLTSPLPSMTHPDRAAWYKVLRWREEDEDIYQLEVHRDKTRPGLEFHQLGPHRYVVGVLFDKAAYQEIFTYYLVDEKRHYFVHLTFPGYHADHRLVRAYGTELLGVQGFVKGTNVLSVFCKFRGLGDCGIWTRYGFVGDRPVMLDCRAQIDGNRPGEPLPKEKWQRAPVF